MALAPGDRLGPYDVHHVGIRRSQVRAVHSDSDVQRSGSGVSPNGQFVAYLSNETGQNEVFVRPIAGPGKWQVSKNGGTDPGWSPDGSELYYFAQQQLMAVQVQTSGSSFAMTAVPRSLFPLQRQAGYPIIVHPVDGRFLLLDRPEADIPQIIGLKDSSGDLAAFHETQQGVAGRRDFSMFMGSEKLIAEAVETCDCTGHRH